MLKFQLADAEVLQRKAKKILKLKKERSKNQAIFTVAFEDILRDKTVKAVMALNNDEFQFTNNFASGLVLEKKFGIKAGKYVQYISKTIAGRVVMAVEDDNEDFEDKKVVKSSAVKSFQPAPAIKEQSRALKAPAMIIEVMKGTDDIEEIYTAWVTQLMELGNNLMNSAYVMSLEEDDSEDVEDDEDDVETGDEYAVDLDEELSEDDL